MPSAKLEPKIKVAPEPEQTATPNFKSRNRMRVSEGVQALDDDDLDHGDATSLLAADNLQQLLEHESSRSFRVAPLMASGQGRLGPYQIVCELASGGMASVYLALYRSVEGFEKLCAVKRIHPHLANDRDFANMFVDEAQLAARISHPFVCGVFSFGKTQGSHYIAMEYLRGEPLSALSRRVARSPELGDDPQFPALAARLIANLAEGLHAAHTLRDPRGVPLDVVHRDVTPQNLFVLYDGTVRVTDFGIAHARRRLHQTEGKKLKGKLSYIAPEQLNRMPVDASADVWGLGVVMWELLASRRLFLGSSEGETLSAVMSREVPAPSTFRASVPAELDRIVLRALERDPQKRYRTARDLSRDLERFLSASGDAVPAMDVADWMTRIFPQGLERIQALVELASQVSAATADETVVRVPSAPPTKGPARQLQESWSSLVPPPDTPTSPREPSDRPIPLPAVHVDREPRPWSENGFDPKSFHIKLNEEPEPTTLQRVLLDNEPSRAFELVRARRDKRHKSLPLLGAAALVVAGLAGLRYLPRAAPPPATRTSAEAQPVTVAPRAPGPAPARPEPATIAPATDAPASKAPGKDKPSKARTSPAPPATSAPAAASAKPTSAPAAASGTGDVFITTPGGSAEVFEDARSLGRTPSVFRLPVGRHALRLKSADGSVHPVTVHIAERATTLVTIPLEH